VTLSHHKHTVFSASCWVRGFCWSNICVWLGWKALDRARAIFRTGGLCCIHKQLHLLVHYAAHWTCEGGSIMSATYTMLCTTAIDGLNRQLLAQTARYQLCVQGSGVGSAADLQAAPPPRRLVLLRRSPQRALQQDHAYATFSFACSSGPLCRDRLTPQAQCMFSAIVRVLFIVCLHLHLCWVWFLWSGLSASTARTWEWRR
jgi:hypothetical protein